MTKDRHGRPVRVGSSVRVLRVPEFLKRDLAPDEWARLESLIGHVFEVCEIDEYGCAWVEKWFDGPEGSRSSHSIGLEPDEMEVVESVRG
jgi:hypothetical protein